MSAQVLALTHKRFPNLKLQNSGEKIDFGFSNLISETDFNLKLKKLREADSGRELRATV